MDKLESYQMTPKLYELFRYMLYKVSWEDCKVHSGGIRLSASNEQNELLEQAAAEYKANGGSWEEWT